MLPEAARYKKEWQKRQRSLIKSDAERSYLYVHLEADSGEPFYVGIGETIGRPWSKKRSNKHSNRAKKHGNRVELIEVPEINWDVACFWEQRWIKALRDAGYDLVNLTDGGDGLTSSVAKIINGSPEARKKNSISVKKAKEKDPDRWFNKLTQQQIWEIGTLIGSKKTIAEKFNVSTSVVYKIRKHIEELLGVPPRPNLGGKGTKRTKTQIESSSQKYSEWWNSLTESDRDEFAKKTSIGRCKSVDHWKNRLTFEEVFSIGTLLLSDKRIKELYGVTGWETKVIRRYVEELLGIPPRPKNIRYDGRFGLANLTASRRTEVANKVWEKRRRRYQYWGA